MRIRHTMIDLPHLLARINHESGGGGEYTPPRRRIAVLTGIHTHDLNRLAQMRLQTV